MEMTEIERMKWIDLVAQAIRVMASRNPVTYAPTIQEYADEISLMASMPWSFIEINKQAFDKTEANAAVIVQKAIK